MRRHTKIGFHSVIVFAALQTLAATPADAVDGVIEINQARALVGGITASDTPGFPVTIRESGSFRLTGNLTVAGSTEALNIFVGGDDVTVDLNGFTIQGPGTGSAIGISGGGGSIRTTIINGNVKGFGGGGVNVLNFAHIENVRSISNGGVGIRVGPNSRVMNCVANDNGNTGIFGTESVITDNQVDNNQGMGIDCSKCVVRRNVATRNLIHGINGIESTITDNVASQNQSSGIDSLASTVLRNAMNRNTSWGVSGKGGYGNNVLNNNNGSVDATNQADAGMFQIGTNVCGSIFGGAFVSCP